MGLNIRCKAWPDVPIGRILHDSLEGLGPAVLDAQRHGVGQELLEGIGRHALQTIGVHAIDEFLEAQNLDLGVHALLRLRGHDAREHDDDEQRRHRRRNQQSGRFQNGSDAKHLHQDERRRREQHPRQDVSVRRLGIHRVHTLALQLGADVVLDGGNGDVELVLQVRQPDVRGVVLEHVVQHDALMRLQRRPAASGPSPSGKRSRGE